MVSNTMLTFAIGLLVGFSSPGRCQDLVDQVNKPPITCLGRITDCATCPSDALCTDISVGRLPGQPQTNDWITDACACLCPDGPQACVPIDSAEAEAAIAAARETTRAATMDAAAASRAAFAAALNATAPDGVEVGSEEWFQWRMNIYMDAWDAHKNATHEALLESQEDIIDAWEALMEMFGHGDAAAPAPEPAAPAPAVI